MGVIYFYFNLITFIIVISSFQSLYGNISYIALFVRQIILMYIQYKNN